MNLLKQIFLNFKFVQDSFKEQTDFLVEKARQEERIKAFSLAQKDLLETMRDDLDTQAEELAKHKLASLLSVVDPKKVVTIDKTRGILFISGERVDDSRLASLKSEAEFLHESEIWQLLIHSIRKIAEHAMFVSGDSIDDMKKGRSVLFTLDSQVKIIDLLRSYAPKK